MYVFKYGELERERERERERWKEMNIYLVSVYYVVKNERNVQTFAAIISV